MVFINIQIPWSGFERNSFEAGLKDMSDAGLKGLYAYDPRAEGQEHPKVAVDYSINGTPWSVVIDREGVVRYTKPTQAEAPIAKVIQAALSKKGDQKE